MIQDLLPDVFVFINHLGKKKAFADCFSFTNQEEDSWAAGLLS
jgi:hypothetical protein